jgi:hypothetical protein
MTIEIKQIEGRVIDRLALSKSIYEQHIQKALQEASALIWKLAIEKAPASTGTLRKSITRDLFPTYAQIYPTVKYGLFVHEGTAPHWPPLSEIQPGGSIYRWAQKKGLNPFLVARAISQKGTKPQPWMKQIADEQEGRVLVIFEEALQNITNDLAN